MILSVCGAGCEGCQFFENPCKGCIAVDGKLFWAVDIFPNGICPIYNCAVNIKHYQNCGQCPELHCNLFREMKDPNMSDEEHLKSIEKRVAVLRNISIS